MVKANLEKPKTLYDMQRMNEYIYGERNRANYTTEQLVARLVEETTHLLELVRKDYRRGFGKKIADVVSWHSAVTNRLKIDIQDAMWEKYPGVCSYCLRPRDCQCGIEHPEEIKDKDFRLRSYRLYRDGREPHTFVEHQALHARLYAWQHKKEFPIIVASHIVEEAGEVSEAFRHEHWEHMEEEMADVLGWAFTLANRMEIDLSDTIWEYYPYACPDCKAGPCVCVGVI
jgi:NTP pyrophosphatase (non-canonical NTP hydrolase)